MSKKLMEENYSDKEIVWVKLGRGLWWPGEVCCEERLPDGLLSSLKTKPISIVRFFNEDQFEFVKSLSNICKYNNPKKHDFIKKGLDSYRANHKHVKKFPEDIELAERLTNGDPSITSREEFQPHSRKSVWADIFSDKKQPKTPASNKKLKPTHTPISLNRSQSFRKSIDHEIRILTQPSTSQTNSYSSNTPGSSEQIYRCHLCDFSSKRVNVVMLHSKSHGPVSNSTVRQNFVPENNVTPVSTLKRVIHNESNKEQEINKISSDSSDDEAICIIRKDIILPKKRGRPFRKETITPTDITIKPRVRGKRKLMEPEPEFKNDTNNIEIVKLNDEISIQIDNDDAESDVEIRKTVSKKSKTENKVEFKKKLLEDWAEDDSDGDTKSPNKSNIGDSTPPENSLNSTYDEQASAKEQKENKSNHIRNDRKDNINSNTITKYRNIPKKDRKREFIFDENTSPTHHSAEVNKSQPPIDEICNIFQNENDTAEIGPELNNLDQKPVTNELPTDANILPTENECESISSIPVEITDTIEIVQECEDVKLCTDNLDEEIKSENHISVDVTPIKDNSNQELDSSDIIKVQILKPSEITCFDFQDDDDLEFAKSPPRRQRNRKSVNMSSDNHNKLVGDIERLTEKDNDIQKQTDMILQITDPPQLPELPILLSAERLNTSDENIISEKKEHSLPPKERGKRIFKSRNRNKIVIGNQTQLVKKHIVEYDVEKESDVNSPNKPTESDLQIAETLINIPSRTSHVLHSNVDENTILTSVISDSIDNNTINDNLPVHVSRKKHLQAAFRAEEEKNQNKGPNDKTTSLSNKPPQLISIPAHSPKQKVILNLKDDLIVNHSNKFEPRTPKKRKPATDDDIKSNTIDENIFDINNMEIVISNDVIQNEPMEHIQSSIEPIVIQTMSDDVDMDSSDEIKENESKKVPKNIKIKTIGQPSSPKMEKLKHLSMASDLPLTKKTKLITKRSANDSPLTAHTSTYKKPQIIQATAGGQIVITSKGQLLTTNSQTQLTSISQTCETTSSCVKSISSTKSKETTSKIQVQSQKIIYPSNKSKSNKNKIDKNNTESPSKVKMSLQSITEMTKLGYIKEKGTERIITATGLKRIKQHLLTGSKDRIPPLTQNNPSDTISTITTTNPISQLTLQLPAAAKIPIEPTIPGDTTESLPQIIPTTSALTSTINSTSEITENYYACAAESFGGPPNSFYLCRAGENSTFIPIDNRALYLDANNRLVEDMPETINTFDTISNQNASTSTVLNCEQVNTLELNTGTSDNIEIQDVPQSFIINTLDGQQIILDQQSFLSLAAGEMPHLITADGQQIILQGSPQDIITAITVNQQDIGLMTDEQHIIIPQCEGQSTLGNNDIISVALEGSDVYQRPEPLIGEVIIQNPSHSEVVANQNLLPTATATVLSNPIMSTLEVPTKATNETNNLTLETGLNIDDSLAAIGVNTTHSNVPSSLELPITVTNPVIASKTSPLNLNTIYTPTISSIGAIAQISQISPSLGYDIFDTSSSSSSSKGTGLCPDKNGNVVSSNITISQLNSHTDNLSSNNSNDNNIEEDIENGNIIPQSPEIEINISSVNDASESPPPCVNYDDNSDNSDEIPIQPNLLIFNNDNNNIDNNGHEMIDIYDNNSKPHIDDVKQSSHSSNINNDKDDRR